MPDTPNFRKNHIIIAAVLAVLAITAVVVAVLVSGNNSGDIPAFVDKTGESSTQDTTAADTTAADTTGTNETTGTQETQPPAPPETPKFFNPLTGEGCSEELSKMRPAAFMINNIKEALPQQGISGLDVLYECLAEGGITRLLMLTQDYTKLEVLGSIRSSRDYYLDFAQNHDALYFHAGGSEKAYSEIALRKIDNFDGVKGVTSNFYYRDSWRLANMSKEHTLVISVDGIKKCINYKGARTQLKEDFRSPFSFNKEVKAPEGNDAKCVYIPFSTYQKPYLKYDSTTNTYKRWQYGEPHVDMTNNKQLEFTNILVLFCHHSGVLDEKGRIEVTTTGTGEGYYISNGKYVPIKYSKNTVDSPLKLFNADNTPLEINVGKTYIAIVGNSTKSQINMNYNA
ncbi:MAG: DUF3048 domain-containing protein [Clostridia bacterium]|nr:DUF3048 domain-containing protein [Clostridia bacterium]